MVQERDRKRGKAGVLNDDHDLSHSHPAGTAGPVVLCAYGR